MDEITQAGEDVAKYEAEAVKWKGLLKNGNPAHVQTCRARWERKLARAERKAQEARNRHAKALTRGPILNTSRREHSVAG